MNDISQIIYPLLTVFWWVPLLILCPIPGGELAAYLRAGPVFVLKPVDDQASMTDDFSNLIQDDETLH